MASDVPLARERTPARIIVGRTSLWFVVTLIAQSALWPASVPVALKACLVGLAVLSALRPALGLLALAAFMPFGNVMAVRLWMAPGFQLAEALTFAFLSGYLFPRRRSGPTPHAGDAVDFVGAGVRRGDRRHVRGAVRDRARMAGELGTVRQWVPAIPRDGLPHRSTELTPRPARNRLHSAGVPDARGPRRSARRARAVPARSLSVPPPAPHRRRGRRRRGGPDSSVSAGGQRGNGTECRRADPIAEPLEGHRSQRQSSRAPISS